MNTDTHKKGSTVKNNLIKNGIFVPIVVPGLSASSSSSLPTSTLMTSSTEIDHSDHLQQSCQAKVWKGKYGETRILLKHQKSC